MKEFNVVFQFDEGVWIASCKELRITLDEHSFDALVVRMRIAIQEIAEVELKYTGDIRLVITMQDRIDEIKAVA